MQAHFDIDGLEEKEIVCWSMTFSSITLGAGWDDYDDNIS
jgi:hypothetical protein